MEVVLGDKEELPRIDLCRAQKINPWQQFFFYRIVDAQPPGQNTVTDILDRVKTALADRYTIEHELGAGGMAIVYLATDLKLDRQVAIKVLRPELAAAMGTDRFVREVELTSQLEHPNILSIFDAGEADGFLYYVMPLVEGESLRDRLNRETQLPLDDAIQITKEIADALGHSHSKGIMHRDIKPENILLSGGRAVVADFGIARAVTMAGGEKLTQTGMAIGTPAYMSPEQAAGTGHVDHRTDIYALGCVLYEMLAGEAPYTGPTAQAIIAKSLSAPIPSIRRVRHAVSEEIDAAITKALDKVPADRFAKASHLIEALEGSRTVARPGRRRIRWRRWVGSAAATLAIILLGAYVVVRNRVGMFGLAQPITVVLAAPAVAPGDSTLGLAIQVALQQALIESKRVTALPVDRVRRTLENMGRSPDARLDSATALEVAERNGAGAVVLANVLQIGGAFQLSAQVLSSNGVLRASATADAAGPNLLIGAIDSLARGLRRELGDKARDLEASRDLSSLLTPSLEALRLWAEADAIYGAGNPDLFLQGEILALQAVALDSNFANAYLTLTALRNILDSDFLAPIERLVSMRDRLGSMGQFVDMLEQLLGTRDPRATLQLLEPNMKFFELPGLAQTFFSGFTEDEIAAFGVGVNHIRAMAHGDLGDRHRAIELYDLIIRDADVLPYASIMPTVFHSMAINLAAVGDRTGAERMLEARRERYGSARDVEVAVAGQEWERAARAIRELHEGPDVRAKAPYDLAWLGTVEAVRGRPTESRAAFARALDAARRMNQPYLERIVQYRRAEAEFFALNDPGRAAVIVASMLAAPPSTEGMRRRLGALAQNLAAAICSLGGSVGEEPPTAGLCDARAPVDSVRDEIEALELMQWSALREGRLDDAARIGSVPALVNAGVARLLARLPSAIAFERLGQPDSAAAVYREILARRMALVTHVPALLVRRSFVLRRLVELGGVSQKGGGADSWDGTINRPVPP